MAAMTCFVDEWHLSTDALDGKVGILRDLTINVGHEIKRGNISVEQMVFHSFIHPFVR
jgi:hypothetical protein